MDFINDVIHGQRGKISERLRFIRHIGLDHNRSPPVDFPDGFGSPALQIPIIISLRGRNGLKRLIDQIISVKLRMVLEAGSDPFPDFDKVIAVFFLGEHPHIAVQITSAGEAVQINHEFDAGLLRPVHRPLQIIEFAVQPSVILFEIKLRAHLAPVARQLGANQVDVPLFQRPDVLVPDGSRRLTPRRRQWPAISAG